MHVNYFLGPTGHVLVMLKNVILLFPAMELQDTVGYLLRFHRVPASNSGDWGLGATSLKQMNASRTL